MTLSDIIKDYCREHGISFRKFADTCGLTSGYITMLISGKNPNTGKPLRPTIETYTKLADGMCITVNELFKIMDDAPIEFNSPDTGLVSKPLTVEERRLLAAYRIAESSAQHYALQMLENNPAQKCRRGYEE